MAKTMQELIIETSTEKLAKLYPVLATAIEKPDTGVKIINKSAMYVIKDSASIAREYLPLMLYGKMQDPISALKPKVTKKMVDQLVKDSESNIAALQLANTIAMNHVMVETAVETPAEDPDNVYGSYGYGSSTENVQAGISLQAKLYSVFGL